MKDGLEHGPPTPPHYKAEKRNALGGINKVPSLKSFMGGPIRFSFVLGGGGGTRRKIYLLRWYFSDPDTEPF